MEFKLDGSNLGVHRLVKHASRPELQLGFSDEGIARIEQGRKLVLDAMDSGEAVYGLTTGLGARVTETLDEKAQAEFSIQTLRGRAHSLGDPLPVGVVRGAMITRLNTLLHGTSGCSPELPVFLRSCLNANLTPVVGSIGSIGAADLCWGATMGLAFTGEGHMHNGQGQILVAAEALADAALEPFVPGPKDGLVLANHACFSASLAAFAVSESLHYIEAVQIAAALAMESMDANLSPLTESLVSASGEQGQIQASHELRALLEGSRLWELGTARKIQDPLSLRNVVQVHGTALTAHSFVRGIVNAALNAPTDNPQVDLEQGRLVSCGAYYSSSLAFACGTLARALDQLVVAQLARMSKLLSERHSGLPRFLSRDSADSNGFAPVLKVAESLVARARQAFSPVDHWPSVNADGMEDIQSNAPLAAQALSRGVVDCCRLAAMEMIMAVEALEIGDHIATLPGPLSEAYREIRRSAAPMAQDRPMGNEIEALAAAICSRAFRIPD